MEILGVSLGPTVDLGRVDYTSRCSKSKMAMARSQLTAQASRRHTFLFPILSDVLPLESLLVLLFSSSSLLSINCDSVPYISSSKSGSFSGFLVLSHAFQNVQSCISNHSIPQITVSVVRQMAHNMHIAYIASCIHVTKNSNNALTTAGFTPCLAHAIITYGGFVTPPPLEKKET